MINKRNRKLGPVITIKYSEKQKIRKLGSDIRKLGNQKIRDSENF